MAGGEFGYLRQIARGTLIKSVGEIVAKVASVAFYVVIARELGDTNFGNFVFALSLSSVLFTISAFGTDGLVTREVARDESRAGHLLADVMSLKLLSGAGLLLVMAGIVVVQGYSQEAAAAILLVGLGVGLETVTKTVYAIFQARMQMHYEAAAMIIERMAVAVFGIVAVLLGANLVVVAAIFAAGSLVGLALALFWLYRGGNWPGWSSDRSRWMAVVKEGIPIGLIIVLYATLMKVDIALLSFLNGGDNTEVGHYGAAYRLIEATMFISWAFGAALYPWLSRHDSSSGVPLSTAYGLGLKVLIAMLLPIALVFGIYASPIIHLVYGADYGDAVLPLQLLAAMTVLYGINSMVVLLMISRDRPGDFTRSAVIVIIQNLAFNFILIPRYGANGAAANAILSGLLLAAITHRQVEGIVGSISMRRVWIPPLVASLALAAVAVASSGGPWILCAAFSLAVYAPVFLGVERLLFPDDFGYYAAVFRPLRQRLLPSRA